MNAPGRAVARRSYTVRGRPRRTMIRMRRSMLLWLVVAALVVLGGTGWWLFAAPRSTPAVATFVGRGVCAECHPRQAETWRGSDHDLAMQPADRRTVLADFGNPAPVKGVGRHVRLARRQVVRPHRGTDGTDRRLRDRLHVRRPAAAAVPGRASRREIPGAESSPGTRVPRRPAGSAGSTSTPAERPRPGDPLHWTGRDQTWNHMCAECHSTNLLKNYRAADDRYETTWSEIDVACEGMSRPGLASRRMGAARRRAGAPPARPATGTGRPPSRSPRRGLADGRRPPASRGATGPAPSRLEIETCARCHARRGMIDDRYVYGRPLLDTHRPALLDAELYHADGQILGEVYEYGSFLQSKMYRAGVTCSDCHDPHSLATAAPPSAVCARCHLPAKFDTPRPPSPQGGLAGRGAASSATCPRAPTWSSIPAAITACACRARICRWPSARPTPAPAATAIVAAQWAADAVERWNPGRAAAGSLRAGCSTPGVGTCRAPTRSWSASPATRARPASCAPPRSRCCVAGARRRSWPSSGPPAIPTRSSGWRRRVPPAR